MLSWALPEKRLEFASLLRSLEDDAERRFALAELNDLLTALAPFEMADAVAAARIERLTPFVQNYVAAMVERISIQHNRIVVAVDGRATAVRVLETAERNGVPTAAIKFVLAGGTSRDGDATRRDGGSTRIGSRG